MIGRIRRRTAEEFRNHTYASVITAIFAASGVIAAPFLFPEVALPLAAAAGGAFGAYLALCGVAHRFLD